MEKGCKNMVTYGVSSVTCAVDRRAIPSNSKIARGH